MTQPMSQSLDSRINNDPYCMDTVWTIQYKYMYTVYIRRTVRDVTMDESSPNSIKWDSKGSFSHFVH